MPVPQINTGALLLASGHRGGHGVRDVRIEHRLAVEGAEVRHFVALGDDERPENFLQRIARFVRANGDFHWIFLTPPSRIATLQQL